ncbi:hypothetical protein MTR_1g074090 [Medicago truncatula]|uniref:RNase H type-1 domain-containing protein n=1 Tax=Medicago truncatula TaxID=3880 RepID=A0A072VL18_MEDTR|nr:hypothetical protein MTR_1g074090 [Medicago truncatula]
MVNTVFVVHTVFVCKNYLIHLISRYKALGISFGSSRFPKDACKICNTSCAQPRQVGNVKWIKPTEGIFKCNIDASFSHLYNRLGIRVCIRDDVGTFVLAKTEWFTPVCDVHVGETFGLLSALELIHQLHFEPIDFELDAKKVIDSFFIYTS